jgi:hypothetical protein
MRDLVKDPSRNSPIEGCRRSSAFPELKEKTKEPAMNLHERIRKKILVLVSSARNQRLRFHDVERDLADHLGVSISTINEVVKDLVRSKELLITYRDHRHYAEIPVRELHVAARPMKVVVDAQGESWICDHDVDPSKDLAAQGCWRCGEMSFTSEDSFRNST